MKKCLKMRAFYFLICFIYTTSCRESDPNILVTRIDTISITKVDTEPTPPPPVKHDSHSSIKKQPRASDNEHWKKKKEEGVHFMVIGNEPFWNLEIRNESIRFHLADWEKPVDIAQQWTVEKAKFNDLITPEIEIRIAPQECSDGMSDYWYDYSVTVIYKGKTYKGCGIAL